MTLYQLEGLNIVKLYVGKNSEWCIGTACSRKIRIPRRTTEQTLSRHRLEQSTLTMRTLVHSLNLLVTLASENLNYHKLKKVNVVESINIKYINTVACKDPLLSNVRERNNKSTPLIYNRVKWSTTEEWCFWRSVPRWYKQNNLNNESGLLPSTQRHGHRSWRISIVKVRYPEMTSENRKIWCML
jgi:N-acetylmuramoyl-L-alanine amidase CwlA